MGYENLAVTGFACTDSNNWSSGGFGNNRPGFHRHGFRDYGEGTRLLHGDCIRLETLGIAGGSPLYTKATKSVDMLRGQANVPHYRHPSLH